jgi:hypothetical protein
MVLQPKVEGSQRINSRGGMTETTIQTDLETTHSGIPLHPTDILMSLIIALLAPMFLAVSGGNINYARMAAIETVNAYRIRNNADLLLVAQIVAFGFAALGSLSLAMADNLSLSMTLRLRANANACHRSAEQNRRALNASAPDTATTPFEPPAEPDEDHDEAAVIAGVAAAQKLVAEAQARMQTEAAPIAHPATPAQTLAATQAVAAPMTAEQQWQSMWASAAVNVAAEFTADLPNLPPAERKAATMRAAALSSSANQLLSGAVAPRLRPGDLNALLRPGAR